MKIVEVATKLANSGIPLPIRCEVWYSDCGEMAEWSIAAVLKTAGLIAPGVRIPLPPPEGNDAFSLCVIVVASIARKRCQRIQKNDPDL